MLIPEAVDLDEFDRLLAEAFEGHGEFGDVSAERMAGGPSYIELGAWIGDQGLALRLIGLGAYARRWEVISPATLGFEPGPEADELAGGGFVMASGLHDRTPI